MTRHRSNTTPDAVRRHKVSVRSKARNYHRRGLIPQQPCSICCSYGSEMHHPDYDRPRLVIWLCMDHHRELHNFQDYPGPMPPLDEWADSSAKPRRLDVSSET